MAVDSQEAIRLAFLLEPGHTVSSTDGFDYLGTRRFLLKTKAQDATLQRHHWQHVSGVGYADFRDFLRAQRDTWRQEREASREEGRHAAAAPPNADVALSEATAGQKVQGKVDTGKVGMGEVYTGKADTGEVIYHEDEDGEREVVEGLGTVQVAIRVDGMTVADGRGEDEEGSDERLAKLAAEAVVAGQSTVSADASAGAGSGAGAGAGADANHISKSTDAPPSFTGSSVDSIAAAVAAALGKSEPPVTASSEAAPTAEGPEEDANATATRAASDAAGSKLAASELAGSGRIGSAGREKLEDGARGAEHRESGIEEEVAIRVSASSGAVNKVQFARHHPDLLAYGAADGTLRLCYVPCSRGGRHTKEVTDFDWSTDDDYLCSSSADKSVRVWDVGSGQCLRIIYTVIPQTCIIFHPQNNNFLVVANSKKELTVMNFSTGRVVSRVAMDSNVTALVADRTTSATPAGSATTSGSSGSGGAGGATSKAGSAAAAAAAGSGGFGGGAGQADSVVFVGDSEGAIHSFTVDKQSGALQRRHKTVAGVVHPAPVASLHFSSTSVLANGPVLLACSKDGCVRFYTTALELNGYLFLKISLQLSSRATNMNAAFCPPLGSSGSGEYIVTGNADHHVYFYDFMKPRSPLVARVPVSVAMTLTSS
ncbi:unnamed protein product [Closterium sp. Yama58-4]|nr:unnamed protein product [Closterium sp. Yama58-4]